MGRYDDTEKFPFPAYTWCSQCRERVPEDHFVSFPKHHINWPNVTTHEQDIAKMNERQYQLKRKQRDREEFEREKRERPWWYENGHHICGLVDGHGH